MLGIRGIRLPPEALEAQSRDIQGIIDAALVRTPDAHGVGRPPRDAAIRIETIPRRHLHQFRVVPLSSLPRTAAAKARRAEIIKALSRDF